MFNVEIVVHAKCVETAVKLNCLQTEMHVTEIFITRPLIKHHLSTSLPKRLQKRSGSLSYPSAHNDLPIPSHISFTR